MNALKRWGLPRSWRSIKVRGYSLRSGAPELSSSWLGPAATAGQQNPLGTRKQVSILPDPLSERGHIHSSAPSQSTLYPRTLRNLETRVQAAAHWASVVTYPSRQHLSLQPPPAQHPGGLELLSSPAEAQKSTCPLSIYNIQNWPLSICTHGC